MSRGTLMTGLFAAILLVVSLTTVRLNAQTDGKDQSKASENAPIPEAALLTERGRQLAQQLRLLRRTREGLGAKHPTLPVVEKKIEAVLEELSAWEPAYGDAEENPFRPGAKKDPKMLNEYDLRQLVLRLAKRVEQLEGRIEKLEGKRP